MELQENGLQKQGLSLPQSTNILSSEFKYKNESVVGLIPYVRNKTNWGVEQWIIVTTTASIYFIYCGYDRAFLVSRKQKVLENELPQKSLQELLGQGMYFYRIQPSQLGDLTLQPGWFTNKVIFKTETGSKTIINLKKTLFLKFKDLYSVALANFKPNTSQINEPVRKETLSGANLGPPMTEEEIKQEKRRKKALAFVLLGNSIISLGLSIWLSQKGGLDEFSIANIIPLIIDVALAIKLLQQIDVLNIVVLRSVLGLIIWGGLLAAKQDWLSLIIQIPYFGYIIYHAKVKATAKSFRIAMGLLIIAIVVWAGVFFYDLTAGKQRGQDFDNRLTQSANILSENFQTQKDLVYKDLSTLTDQEVKDNFKKIEEISNERTGELDQALSEVEQGLNEFKDSASQKNLNGLKTLYGLEKTLNAQVLDFAIYGEGLDLQNITDEQNSFYENKIHEIENSYTVIAKQGQAMQDSQ